MEALATSTGRICGPRVSRYTSPLLRKLTSVRDVATVCSRTYSFLKGTKGMGSTSAPGRRGRITRRLPKTLCVLRPWTRRCYRNRAHLAPLWRKERSS